MSASTLRVVRPGLLTTVQDTGRWGYQALGVPVAGPMDWFSHRLANLLVGNRADAATLEVTLMGPELSADAPLIAAVTGARFEITCDEAPVPLDAAFVIPRGGRLRFGTRLAGARAYLAVAGGFLTPVVLGSRATHLPSALGGIDGRALIAGDILPVGDADAASGGPAPPVSAPSAPSASSASSRASVPSAPSVSSALSASSAQSETSAPSAALLPRTSSVSSASSAARSVPSVASAAPSAPSVLPVARVLRGSHAAMFEEAALATLTGIPFVVGLRSNRMGFRLEGASIDAPAGATLVTEPLAEGTIQVPPSGEPILLMADRQTSGGYPKIATVIRADLPLVGQLAPGDRLAFQLVDRAAAAEALIRRERYLLRYTSSTEEGMG